MICLTEEKKSPSMLAFLSFFFLFITKINSSLPRAYLLFSAVGYINL